jgi:hypothetical protein
MLKITELPRNVLEVTAEGIITGTDYETVFIPAVEEKLKSNKQIRLLYHLGTNFTGFDIHAMLDDAKVGMKHLTAWEKIAFVSDHGLINAFAKFFGYFLSCETRIFKNEELEMARNWISE